MSLKRLKKKKWRQNKSNQFIYYFIIDCARTRWILREAKMEDLPHCCTNGNFEAWQCIQDLCYCVDNNGNQVSIELPENEKSNLPCYKKNNGNSCVY